MSISVVQLASLDRKELRSLEERLKEYYVNPPESYYRIAGRAADQYTPAILPYHCDLVSRVHHGMSVVEVGCGPAHLCPLIEAAGASYTGIDHSLELLGKNRDRFRHARFLRIGTEVGEKFDVVASLYTLEHIADPLSYLEDLWNYCKPNGLIAIICPDFVDGEGFPPSFCYGRTPRRLRAKISAFDLADTFAHLLDLLWFAPQWKARARATPPGAFWINVKPRVLSDALYSIDSDAVHLARLRDIIWWMERRGAEIVATSLTMQNKSESGRHNCYVVARRSS